MSKTERILLVEDNRVWAKAFVDILRECAGEKREVDIYDLDEFQDRLSSPQQFEQYGTCLIDLELKGGSKPAAGDLAGLTDVLPQVRRLAPWLPAACISRYIASDSPVIGKLSCSDFDFFSPKEMIGEYERPHPDFNASYWKGVLKSMQIKRIVSICGRSVEEVASSLSVARKVEVDSETATALAALGGTKQTMSEALSALGIAGSELFIEALQPGFSGVNVARVTAHGYEDDEPVYAYWLLKWGRPVWKIEEEAQAHRRFLCRGIERMLQVPQLNPHAIFYEGIGYAAYAFEKSATLAIDHVRSGRVGPLATALGVLANNLYIKPRQKPIQIRRELERWVGLDNDTLKAAVTEEWPESCEVSWSLLHGDLHLRNLFVREPVPVLIDFARSAFGPVGIDVAKILIDTLVVCPPGRGPDLLTIEGIKSSELSPLFEAFAQRLMAPGDHIFLSAALRAFAQKYTTYPDVGSEAKMMLLNLLSRVG